jgi:hypothetical protein
MGRRGWEHSHQKYNKAKILIKSKWVRANVTKFLRGSSKPSVEEPFQLQPFQLAPPILKLESHEKFRDALDNVFEVEVRGFREREQIYFKTSDIELLLEMDNSIKRLKKIRCKLEEDYVLFLVDKQSSSRRCAFEPKRVRRTFITYNGLLKLIFRSRSSIAYRFRKWATRIVYSGHMGTEEQRFDQALNIGRVNPENYGLVVDGF